MNGVDTQHRKELTPDEIKKRTKELRVANRYKAEQLQATLLESLIPYGDSHGFGGSDSYEQFWLARNTGGGGYAPPAQGSDRRGGAKWPMWRTDIELNRLRQDSRIVFASNAYAKGLVKNMTNYVIGKGMGYKSTPKKNDKAKQFQGIEQLTAGVDNVMSHFCARNGWNASAGPNDVDEDGGVASSSSTKERESYWRVLRDGEVFIRLFYRDDGNVDVRFVSPELIWGVPPGETQADGWSYGIKHRVTEEGEDQERIEAYYVRNRDVTHQPIDGRDNLGGEIVPASEMIHIKDSWEDAEVKRGTPALSYDTLDALLRASKLQRNISVSAAVRAATAEVWKHSVGSQAQIQSLENSRPGARQVGNIDGITQRTEQLIYPGMIRRTPQGQEPVPFPSTTNVPEHQQAAQGDLRQACAGFSAPEYMTGTTNEANMATASESGAPFVRSAESEQEHFKVGFTRLMWRVIRHAVRCQRLPNETLELITISTEAQEVKKNNDGELAQVRSANLQNKITSPQIEIMRIGNDPVQVIDDWKKWDAEMGGQQQPGGMPGAGPDGGDDPDGGDGSPQGGGGHPLDGVPKEELSKDVQESAQQGSLFGNEPGFTGEITDKLGRKVKFQDGKRLKGQHDEPAKKGAKPSAKLGKEAVEIVSHDPQRNLVKVRGKSGEETVVHAHELDFGSKPEHGERAATANASYHDMIAKAKAARIDAFAQVKADAIKARDKVQEHVDKMTWALNGELYWDSDNDEPFNDLDTEITHRADDDASVKERYESFKAIEEMATEALKYEQATEKTDDDEQMTFTPQEISKNKATLKLIAQHAREARKHIKAFVQFRKEMQAIKEGSTGDVREALEMMDVGCGVDLLEGEWDEEKHPRDHGKFASKEGGNDLKGDVKIKKALKSKAKVVVGVNPLASQEDKDKYKKAVESKWRHIVGDEIPIDAAASFVGAPDDAECSILHGSYPDGRPAIWINVVHKDYKAKRLIEKTVDGEIVMHNKEFWMNDDAQGNGIGASIFTDQVEALAEIGANSIVCHAAKENPVNPKKPHNGYYTWPRFGYDMSLTDDDGIDESDADIYEQCREEFPEAETLLDVMSTKKGRDWWKQNGTDALNMKFDLTANSRSMKILAAYREERGSKKSNSPTNKTQQSKEHGVESTVNESAEPHDTEDLAHFYAETWGSMTPEQIGEEEIATVNDELAGGDYSLSWDDDAGKWVVTEGVGGVLLEAVHHAPKGGVTINGKKFRGGMFIPSADYEKATPEEKAKIDEPAKAASDKRKARGSVDTEKVRGKIKDKHGHHELTAAEKTSAKRSLNALIAHHGELTVHRLEEIADSLHAAYDKTPEDEEGQRAQFSRRLKAVEHMLDMAKEKGHSGEVKKFSPTIGNRLKYAFEMTPDERAEYEKIVTPNQPLVDAVGDFVGDRFVYNADLYKHFKENWKPEYGTLSEHNEYFEQKVYNANKLVIEQKRERHEKENGIKEGARLDVVNTPRGEYRDVKIRQVGPNGMLVFSGRKKGGQHTYTVTLEDSQQLTIPEAKKAEQSPQDDDVAHADGLFSAEKGHEGKVADDTPGFSESLPEENVSHEWSLKSPATEIAYAKHLLNKTQAAREPVKAKEPWEMTRQEYVDQEYSKWNGGKEHREADKQQLSFNHFNPDHESAVADAVHEGKPVPPNVLADYPDLQGKKEEGDKFGKEGDGHPLAGLSPEQKRAKVSELNLKANDGGVSDVEGVAKAGPPKDLDMKAFGADLAQAVNAHVEANGVGDTLPKFYEAVGKKHGLSKFDFLRAVHKEYEDGNIRLGGWPGTLHEIPDPDLFYHVSGKGMYYIHGVTDKAKDTAKAEPDTGSGKTADAPTVPPVAANDGNDPPKPPDVPVVPSPGDGEELKKTWQMSLEEYKKSGLNKSGYIDSVGHAREIEKAIKAGEPVPSEISDQYVDTIVAAFHKRMAGKFGEDYRKQLQELASKSGGIHEIVTDHGGGVLTTRMRQTGANSFDARSKGDAVRTPDGAIKIVSKAGKPYTARAGGEIWGYMQEITIRDPKKTEKEAAERAIAARDAVSASEQSSRNQDYADLQKEQIAKYESAIEKALGGK